MVHCTTDGLEMVIINVYSHPQASVPVGRDFLITLEDNLTCFGCANIICCGDFNSVLDPRKDTAAWNETRMTESRTA